MVTVHPATRSSTIIGVIHRRDRRRILLRVCTVRDHSLSWIESEGQVKVNRSSIGSSLVAGITVVTNTQPYNPHRLAVEKFSKSRVSSKVPDKNTLILWSYPNFLTTLFRIGQRKLTRQKPALSSSHFNILPACDGLTDGQTHDDSIYPAVKMNITALTTVIIIIIITTHTHIHTQPFNGPLSGTTQVCWY